MSLCLCSLISVPLAKATKLRPILLARVPRISSDIPRIRSYVNGSGEGPNPIQVGPQAGDTEKPLKAGRERAASKWSPTVFKMFESAATTFASILVLA